MKIFSHENASENIVCEMASILSKAIITGPTYLECSLADHVVGEVQAAIWTLRLDGKLYRGFGTRAVHL